MAGLFERLGFTSESRHILFLSGCVPARILLAFAVPCLPPRVVSIVALLSFVYLMSAPSAGRWHRKMHALTALSVALLAAAGKLHWSTPLLLIDLMYGANTLRF